MGIMDYNVAARSGTPSARTDFDLNLDIDSVKLTEVKEVSELVCVYFF